MSLDLSDIFNQLVKRKGTSDDCSKLQREKSISLDMKLPVSRRLETGELQVDVDTSLDLATSMIRTIATKCE
ncbi:hypothetical protein T4B_11973 [Trichinella pseudospiralis]|uniref:Uncharacterized protein n=1 Tax=Trichinella pseudospiralis TaxID=6337 RepID=A0A0V1E0A7_TRIPS|nr:hypothetical protein T4E_1810 [Trichinella pseudospiralis]KRY67245.1 hypothetical protein T4A_8354 [Trichinella pseudospiralis]KRZ21573.1 hypothetical protein T4B_11973 [Trichinella pseudospiralis]KRZ27513.1 hypothetical protein T4C_11585 [Trichinella pseudospiralis]